MHVLQLTDFYRPVIGGLERHVETLSRELIRYGHTVSVVTLQTGDDPAEEILDGVRVIRIRGWSGSLPALHADAARPFHPTVPDPGAMAALRRVIQRERPAVVHSHSWIQYSYFPLHHGPRGPAHVVTLHDYGVACAKRTLQHVTRRAALSAASPSGPRHPSRPCSGPRLAKCLACAPEQYGVLKGAAITTGLRASRILHGRADCYIAISRAVADASRAALPAQSEIVVVPTIVPNGLPELARSTPRPGFLPPEDGYLMFVGALGPHKGVDVLLEARRRMRNRLPLVLIGTPRADTPRIDDPEVVLARNVPSAQVMASWMRASVPSSRPSGANHWDRWPSRLCSSDERSSPPTWADYGTSSSTASRDWLCHRAIRVRWRRRWTTSWTIRGHGSAWVRRVACGHGTSRRPRWRRASSRSSMASCIGVPRERLAE